MRHVVVDPRFSATLRDLRQQRALSLRELARLVPSSHAHIHDLERERKTPSPEFATRLDQVLEAGGDLAAMVTTTTTSPEQERLSYVATHPRRIDVVTVDALAELLARQRRLEDMIGSELLLRPVCAQLAMVADLVRDAPDGRIKETFIDVAGQWAQFAAWLSATTGDHATARQHYLQAMEWATEAGNPHMVSTVLSMRGHLAWITNQPRAMVKLSLAAQWQPASPGALALATQQEGRGLAILGDAAGADQRLNLAEELAHQAASNPGAEPPWLYFTNIDFFAAQRGLAQLYLGRHELAAELLSGALDRLPPEIRRSDWIGWYVVQMAGAYAAAGEIDEAVTLLDEARQTAEQAAARRLASDVDQMARQLGV